ncbi:hypothetical protein B0H14DRAFT_3174440 [Mycena olivaceomarginata]|nr:hypothetical protein B0H14DRAFT_3174440 [Mycena olivaceomarginata]
MRDPGVSRAYELHGRELGVRGISASFCEGHGFKGGKMILVGDLSDKEHAVQLPTVVRNGTFVQQTRNSPLYYLPVEIFNNLLKLTCGTYLNHLGLYTASRTLSDHFVHQRACLRAVSRDWRKAINDKGFLWNTWCGITHGSIKTFDECTSHFGPGPVDLRLEFKTGPACPGKVSTPRLLELVNTVSEQCATLKLFMVDDIDTAEIISTVHANRFRRLSNLSITVLYGGNPSYDDAAPETPCPAVFAHFPNTLKDLRLHGHPVPWTTLESFGLLTTLVLNYLGCPNSPTVGEFEALFNAAPNLERLSIKYVAASVGHRDLGSLISRVDAPNLMHLELEMWTMSDFEILELCRKTFRLATNLTIGGDGRKLVYGLILFAHLIPLKLRGAQFFSVSDPNSSMSNVSLVKGRGAALKGRLIDHQRVSPIYEEEIWNVQNYQRSTRAGVDWNGDIVWAIKGNTSQAVGIAMCRVTLSSSVKELPQRAAVLTLKDNTGRTYGINRANKCRLGFTFTTAALGAICELFPLATVEEMSSLPVDRKVGRSSDKWAVRVKQKVG